MLKRYLALFLSVMLIISALPISASAANSAVASTLRLERIEGNVTAKNSAGKVISVNAGGKIYNGYSISTASKSYAYISLDSSKAVKVDANSSVKIKQSGKKLEVCLSSGNLYFNVSVPVSSDGSLSIRTSTMVTGVRGTSGVVRVIDGNTSEIYILTGEVTIWTINPITGQEESTTVKPGQVAVTEVYENGEESYAKVTVRSFTEEELLGFACKAVEEGDAAYLKKIDDSSNLDSKKIIGLADDRLKADQDSYDDLMKDVEDAMSELFNKKAVDPLFTKDGGDDGPIADGGSSGGGPTPPPPPPPTSYTITGTITGTQLQALLDNFSYTHITVGATGVVNISSMETVTIDPGQTLLNQGTINNNGTVHNFSNTTFHNDTTGTVTGTGSWNNGDGVSNPGSMIIDGIMACGTISNALGTLTIPSTGSLTVGGIQNFATFTTEGIVTLSGQFAQTTGTANFNGGMFTSTFSGAVLDITGGIVNANGGDIAQIGPAGTALVLSAGTVNLAGAHIMNKNPLNTNPAADISGGTFTMNSGTVSSMGTAAMNILSAATATYYGGIVSSTNPAGMITGGGNLQNFTVTVFLKIKSGQVIVGTSYNDIFNKINEPTTILVTDNGADLYINENINIPDDKTITLKFDNNLIMGAGYRLTSYGTLTFEGNGTDQGQVMGDQYSVSNYGTLNIKNEMTATVHNVIGSIVNIKDGAKFEPLIGITPAFLNSGTLNIEQGGQMSISRYMIPEEGLLNLGTINVYGVLRNEEYSIMINTGTIKVYGTFENTVNGELQSSGAIEVLTGKFKNVQGATGTDGGGGSLITMSPKFQNTGTVVVGAGTELENSGEISTNAQIQNGGTFKMTGGVLINNTTYPTSVAGGTKTITGGTFINDTLSATLTSGAVSIYLNGTLHSYAQSINDALVFVNASRKTSYGNGPYKLVLNQNITVSGGYTLLIGEIPADESDIAAMLLVDIEIDLNGKTVGLDGLSIDNYCDLKISDSAGGGKIHSVGEYTYALIFNDGKLEVTGGTFENSDSALLISNNELKISGGTFIDENTNEYSMSVISTSGSLEITGGTFTFTGDEIIGVIAEGDVDISGAEFNITGDRGTGLYLTSSYGTYTLEVESTTITMIGEDTHGIHCRSSEDKTSTLTLTNNDITATNVLRLSKYMTNTVSGGTYTACGDSGGYIFLVSEDLGTPVAVEVSAGTELVANASSAAIAETKMASAGIELYSGGLPLTIAEGDFTQTDATHWLATVA